MDGNWEIRSAKGEAPSYLPTADYFTIQMYYGVGEIENWSEYRFAGFIDFCAADYISRLELLHMVKDLKLYIEGCSIWWKENKSERIGKAEIKNDLDAVAMALGVDQSRVTNVYVKVSRLDGNITDGVATSRSAGGGQGIDVVDLEEDPDDDPDDLDDPEEDPNPDDVEDPEEDPNYPDDVEDPEEDANDHVEQTDNFQEEVHEGGNVGDNLGGKEVEAGNLETNLEGEVDEQSALHDSDYSFDSERDEEEVAVDEDAIIQAVVEDIRGQEDDGHEEVNSDYEVSEELQSCSSTDEDELDPARAKYTEFNEELDMKDPQFKIGMKFRNFKQFKEAVKSYGIKNRCVMNFRPNNQKRCKAFCKKGCPFYLWASPMMKDKSTVQIKAGYLKHECTRDHNIRHVNAQWIAQHYLEQFRADPSWKISGIIQAVRTNQEVQISRLKAWRARNIAVRLLDGDEHTQMSRLYDYRLELLRTHPGSSIKFRCADGIFQAMYVCLSPLREGFIAGCRQIVSVDGCFLKGHYGGQLLSAVGIDANDCIYPTAWAVVDRENYQNWLWFLELLAEDLHITNSHSWAFMSDRQKGLQAAIDELFPNSEHRFCVRHLHTNFRKKFRGKALKDQVWACARSSYLPAFNLAMDSLKDMSAEAHAFMKNISPVHWSRAHFRTQFKCDMLLNNLCECFNSQILQARTKGIVTMNEMIRTQLMCRIQKKRDAMKKCSTQHCPRILNKLEKAKHMSWSCRTSWSGGDKYQVVGPNGQFIVGSKNRTCTCRKWQLTGIPCSHAISSFYYNKNKPEDYIDACYKVDTFLATYSHILHPTQDSNCWPKSPQGPMIPPEPANRNRGRKTLLRRKDAAEENTGFTNGKVSRKGVIIKCSICGNAGHNKRYHGQVPPTSTASTGVHNDQDPMETIDPQVLEEHFFEADLVRSSNANEAFTNEAATDDPLSQVVDIPVDTHVIPTTTSQEHVTGQVVPASSMPHVINIPVQAHGGPSTAFQKHVAVGVFSASPIAQGTPKASSKDGAALKIQKLVPRRGNLSRSQANRQFPARPPVFR